MKQSGNEMTEILFNNYISEHFDSKENIKHKELDNSFSFERLKLLFGNNYLFVSTVNFLGIVVMIYFLLILFK
jgi:hypothetical protein